MEEEKDEIEWEKEGDTLAVGDTKGNKKKLEKICE